jgi:hypothetical protein
VGGGRGEGVSFAPMVPLCQSPRITGKLAKASLLAVPESPMTLGNPSADPRRNLADPRSNLVSWEVFGAILRSLPFCFLGPAFRRYRGGGETLWLLRWRWHHTDATKRWWELPLSRHADAMRTSGFLIINARSRSLTDSRDPKYR